MLSMIRMPQMGVSDESAILCKWLVREGERIRRGQPVFSLETDKATFQYEAESDGFLVRILTGEGEEAAVGSPVGVLSDSEFCEGSELDALLCERETRDAKPQPRTEPGTNVPLNDPETNEPEGVSVQIVPEGMRKISPRARNKANELGVNLETIRSGSGPRGRIVERDVIRSVQMSSTGKGFERKTRGIWPGRQLTVADRINTKPVNAETAGQTGSVSRPVDARKILAACTPQNRLTPGVVICHELARALLRMPELNARRHGDRIYEYGSVHLRLTVETPSGTLRPVVRCAEAHSLNGLAALMRNATERCRRFASKPQEFQEGTFSVADLSEFGADCFTPELTPPELCALGIGAVVMQTKAVGPGGIEAYPAIRLTLVYDRAGVDALHAAKFLNELAIRLEAGGPKQ